MTPTDFVHLAPRWPDHVHELVQSLYSVFINPQEVPPEVLRAAEDAITKLVITTVTEVIEQSPPSWPSWWLLRC